MQQWSLPDDWGWFTLPQVCGINPRRPRIQRDPEALTSFIPMEAVDELEGKFKEVQARPFREVRSGYTYFEESDVLLAKITPSMENGKAAIARGLIDGFGFGTTEFHVFRPIGLVPRLIPEMTLLPEWIFYYIRRKAFRDEAKSNFRGAVGQQRVPQSFLETYPIPVPYPDDIERSVATQRRIVARIEALLAEVREMRELNTQILTNTSILRRSVVLNLFQDLERSQKDGWRRIKIDNDSVAIKSGFACARRNMVSQGVPHLRPFNIDIKGEVIITDDTVHIPPDFRDDLDEFRLLPGDVLFNNTNSVELVGKSGIVRKPMAVAFSNHLNRIRVRDPETLDPRWLVLALRYLFEKGFFAANCVKWIGQAGFSITRLSEVEILLPDFNTQQKVIAQVESAQSEIDEMEFYSQECSQLIANMEQAILAQAFRGEL